MSDDGNYHWKNLDFGEDFSDPDYYVVVNHPKTTDKFDPAKTIVFQMEPVLARRNWPVPWNDPYWQNFFYVFDIPHHRMNAEWHISTSYRELLTLKIVKTKQLSAIVPSQKIYPGHVLRVDFLRYMEKAFPDYDLFSHNVHPDLKNYRGPLPFGAKEGGHFPYKYTFNAENSWEPNYFSEKIRDAIISECLCFYWGCPNLEEFIDARAFIRIDLNKPDEAINIMKTAMENNEWEKRIDVIRAEKFKIITEMQALPTIKRLIDTRIDQSKYVNTIFDKVYCINLDRCVDRWTRSQQEFSRIKLNVERFPAIDGKTLTISGMIEQGYITNTCNEREKMGVLGVIMSNISIWQTIVEKQIPRTLILEDDVTFHPHFLDLFEKYWNSVPSDADIVFIGSTSPKWGKLTEEVTLLPYSTIIDDKVVKLKQSMQGAFAYVVTLKCAEILLKRYLPITTALDYFPTDIFNIYAFRRVPGTPLSFYQDASTWGGYEINTHGLISVRSEVSTISHRNRQRIELARNDRNNRNFSAAYTHLILARNEGYNDPVLWSEITVTCFYLGRYNEGLEGFTKLIEWTQYPRGKEFFNVEKERIRRNITYYEKKGLPEAKEIAAKLAAIQ